MNRHPRTLAAAPALLLALLAGGCAAPDPHPGTLISGELPPAGGAPAAAMPAAMDVAAAATMPGADRPRRSGSGFFVDATRLVTNHHVAAGCSRLAVRIGGRGAWGAARLKASDPELDLALLESDLAASRSASFDMATVARPERLAIVGYPARARLVGGSGDGAPSLVAASATAADLGARSAMFPLSGDVRQGHSGSPVLDETGAVVGVVAKKVYTLHLVGLTGRVEDGAGLAIGRAAVLGFLARQGVGYRTDAAPAPLPPERRLDDARSFVAQIRCWT
jgi:S1-C subfamily serine protease